MDKKTSSLLLSRLRSNEIETSKFWPYKKPGPATYYCQACKYPPCDCGKQREGHNAVESFIPYVCPECRRAKQQKCSGTCGKDLPLDAFDFKDCRHRYKVCRACQHPLCARCKTPLEAIWRPNPKAKAKPPFCNACSKKQRS